MAPKDTADGDKHPAADFDETPLNPPPKLFYRLVSAANSWTKLSLSPGSSSDVSPSPSRSSTLNVFTPSREETASTLVSPITSSESTPPGSKTVSRKSSANNFFNLFRNGSRTNLLDVAEPVSSIPLSPSEGEARVKPKTKGSLSGLTKWLTGSLEAKSQAQPESVQTEPESPELKAQLTAMLLKTIEDFRSQLRTAQETQQKVLNGIEQVITEQERGASTEDQEKAWNSVRIPLNRMVRSFENMATGVEPNITRLFEASLPPEEGTTHRIKMLQGTQAFKDTVALFKDITDAASILPRTPIVGDTLTYKDLIEKAPGQWPGKPAWQEVKSGLVKFSTQNFSEFDTKLAGLSAQLNKTLGNEVQAPEREEALKIQFESTVGKMIFWGLEKVQNNKEVILNAIRNGGLAELQQLSGGQGPLRALTTAFEQIKTMRHPGLSIDTQAPKALQVLQSEAAQELETKIYENMMLISLGDDRTYDGDIGGHLPRFNPADQKMREAIATKVETLIDGTIERFHGVVAREFKLDSPSVRESLQEFYGHLKDATEEVHATIDVWKPKVTVLSNGESVTSHPDKLLEDPQVFVDLHAALRNLASVKSPDLPPHLMPSFAEVVVSAKKYLETELIPGIRVADLYDTKTISSLTIKQKDELTRNVRVLFNNLQGELNSVDVHIPPATQGMNLPSVKIRPPSSLIYADSLSQSPTSAAPRSPEERFGFPEVPSPIPKARDSMTPDYVTLFKKLQNLERTQGKLEGRNLTKPALLRSGSQGSSTPSTPSSGQSSNRQVSIIAGEMVAPKPQQPSWSSIDTETQGKIETYFNEVVGPDLQRRHGFTGPEPKFPANPEVKDLEVVGPSPFSVQVFKVDGDHAIGVLTAGTDVKNGIAVTLRSDLLLQAHKEKLQSGGSVKVSGSIQEGQIKLKPLLAIDTGASQALTKQAGEGVHPPAAGGKGR